MLLHHYIPSIQYVTIVLNVLPSTKVHFVQLIRLYRYTCKLLKFVYIHILDINIPSHLGNEYTQ